MWSYLINSIELLSNHKSFSLNVDTTSNSWLLLHFKDLEIKSKKILYQMGNGRCECESNVNPYRWMRKKHKNTVELLDYLDSKRYVYNISKLEIEFTNGWKIKQLWNIECFFYTNSTQERDDLIHRLLNAAGQGPIDVSNLEPNFVYLFKGPSKLVRTSCDGLPSPDEFWTEEEVNAWTELYEEHERKEYLKANPEQAANPEQVPFTSTMNISKESTGIKLEGWTEEDILPF